MNLAPIGVVSGQFARDSLPTTSVDIDLITIGAIIAAAAVVIAVVAHVIGEIVSRKR